MLQSRLPAFVAQNYECHEWKHASAILSQDFPDEWDALLELLIAFRLRKSWIVSGGGNKTKLAAYIDGFLASRGWVEKQFRTAIEVDGKRLDSPTHKVDCYKNGVALEIEWNNKDPFYERDLNNFRLLFDLRAVSVGIVITRSDELQGILTILDEDPPMAIRPPTCRNSFRGSKAAAERAARCSYSASKGRLMSRMSHDDRSR